MTVKKFRRLDNSVWVFTIQETVGHLKSNLSFEFMKCRQNPISDDTMLI